MRTQHHYWPSGDGGRFDAWDVARLIRLSEGLPVEEVRLDSFTEVDTDYWTMTNPTVRQVIDHARLILAVDRRFPIILRPDGHVMDGMHRICRALLDERTTIDAVRFRELPEPDHRDVALGAL